MSMDHIDIFVLLYCSVNQMLVLVVVQIYCFSKVVTFSDELWVLYILLKDDRNKVKYNQVD